MEITWQLKTFDELTNLELYEVLRLRNEVFIVEQHCNFQDLDNKDQKCRHLLGFRSGELAAYARIVPPGLSYQYPSIGRILVSQAARRTGAGVALLNKSIAELEAMYGKTPICIGAQVYLRRFYGSFGFVQSSEEYLEDEIPHIEMTRS
jgi:ElaA protein